MEVQLVKIWGLTGQSSRREQFWVWDKGCLIMACEERARVAKEEQPIYAARIEARIAKTGFLTNFGSSHQIQGHSKPTQNQQQKVQEYVELKRNMIETRIKI